MKTSGSKPSLIIACSLVLLLALYAEVTPGPARADVGVKPILPGGSNITAEEETPIQMAAERVEMTVRKATAGDNGLIQLNPEAYAFPYQEVWYTAVAEVKADFSMLNPTSNEISMTVWFPLASSLEDLRWEINPDEIVPQIQNFAVSVDGNPADFSRVELPNPQGADKPLLPWASFPITFIANGYTNIQVRYLLPLVPSIKGSPLALYYVFQTGAGWAGTIGQAELVVNLPYPASPETMADLSYENLSNLPYFMAGASSGFPEGAITEGNTARWVWKEFEPGPKDDFSIWLIDPTAWNELDDARIALQSDPENGARWLRLADIYRSLATVAYNYASAFSDTYRPLGIEAYQKAISLLPEHPAPHAGLGMLILSQYMREANSPELTMQSILSEQNQCRVLASKSPYAEAAEDYCWQLEDLLSTYYSNSLAISEASARNTAAAQSTLDAATAQAPTATPDTPRSPTETALPTPAGIPTAVATPLPDVPARDGNIFLIPLGIGLATLIIVGYLVLKRLNR